MYIFWNTLGHFFPCEYNQKTSMVIIIKLMIIHDFNYCDIVFNKMTLQASKTLLWTGII